jgi:putative transposase
MLIVFLDCLVIKVRANGRVINKSLYFALAVNIDGYKELLGMWISPDEGAKFWLSVLTEIHNRGVHMVRNSVAFVPWQQRK